jgi:hypothetical protein
METGILEPHKTYKRCQSSILWPQAVSGTSLASESSSIAENQRRPDTIRFVDHPKNKFDGKHFALLHDERRTCSSAWFQNCRFTISLNV